MQLKTVALICILVVNNVIASQGESAPSDMEKPREEPSQKQPSGPQGPIAGQEGEPDSGVIVVKPKPLKQEQPGSAQGGPVSSKNILAAHVDDLGFLWKNATGEEIGTDDNIFEAIKVAKGTPLGFLFNVASPNVLRRLVQQDKRPNVNERAKKALEVYERLDQLELSRDFFGKDKHDAVIELIGGITTLGAQHPRNQYLTDGAWAAILGKEQMFDYSYFQMLLDEARPTAIKLALNSKWMRRWEGDERKPYHLQECYNTHPNEAYVRYVALKEAHDECVGSSLARGLSVRDAGEVIGSFLQRQPVVKDITTEPSVHLLDLSILEPIQVHPKKGIPKEIVELATNEKLMKERIRLVGWRVVPTGIFELSREQVKRVRPYGPALVTHAHEQKKDLRALFRQAELYSDHSTFVAFLNLYGPDLDTAGEFSVVKNVFFEFHKALGAMGLANALLDVRNFYAALYLFKKIPVKRPFDLELLRFLAATRLPLGAFSPIMVERREDQSIIRREGDPWFREHAKYNLLKWRVAAIKARRVEKIREAAKKNELGYLRAHILDGNISDAGLQLILAHEPELPMEVFNLILSVISTRCVLSEHMAPAQRERAEQHNAIYSQLHDACTAEDFDSIETLLRHPDCTPGMRAYMLLKFPSQGALMENVSVTVCRLVLAKWMEDGAPRHSEALNVVIHRCRDRCFPPKSKK
jgi:hypothetical protein